MEQHIKFMYDQMYWKSVSGPLFLNEYLIQESLNQEYASCLEYDNDMKVLSWNKNLSGILGVLSKKPDILLELFPQVRFNYARQDKVKLVNFLLGKEFLFETSKFKAIESKIYYEGFVRVCDEGYFKTLYVNSLVPHHIANNKAFYIGGKNDQVWVHMLVKTLAKYFGSYE